ncbi:MAG TPA: hypothetical protein VFE18_16280, partial [Phenylobacterium sp.]|uniref:hypothetical protein n=1 Tax=Phenylobacterium sp. TaxID=1871053 RepID=UPI002D4BE8C5
MPKSWHALPYPDDPRVLVKAPDYRTFQEKEHELNVGHRLLLPLAAHKERPIAVALMEAIEEIKELPL